MKLTKELEGQVVYLRPTGNNARRWDKLPIQAEIKKVARVNVTFEAGGFGRKGRFRGDYIDLGYNSGYQVFASLEAFDEYLITDKISSDIARKYTYPSDYRRLELSKLVRIAKILGLETYGMDK